MTELIIAMDVDDRREVSDLLDQVEGLDIIAKVGLQFFCNDGLDSVVSLQCKYPNIKFFMDTKFHDIPTTVAAAVAGITRNINPWMLNVHATGGYDMMVAAREARDRVVEEEKLDTKPLIIAVTILTSIDEDSYQLMYNFPTTRDDQSLSNTVARLTQMAFDAGLDGVVCSGHEAAGARKIFGPDAEIVVPGVTPSYAPGGSDRLLPDQLRPMF